MKEILENPSILLLWQSQLVASLASSWKEAEETDNGKVGVQQVKLQQIGTKGKWSND